MSAVAVQSKYGLAEFALLCGKWLQLRRMLAHFLHNHFCPDFPTSLGSGLVVEDWGESMVTAICLDSIC